MNSHESFRMATRVYAGWWKGAPWTVEGKRDGTNCLCSPLVVWPNSPLDDVLMREVPGSVHYYQPKHKSPYQGPRLPPMEPDFSVICPTYGWRCTISNERLEHQLILYRGRPILTEEEALKFAEWISLRVPGCPLSSAHLDAWRAQR